MLDYFILLVGGWYKQTWQAIVFSQLLRLGLTWRLDLIRVCSSSSRRIPSTICHQFQEWTLFPNLFLIRFALKHVKKGTLQHYKPGLINSACDPGTSVQILNVRCRNMTW